MLLLSTSMLAMLCACYLRLSALCILLNSHYWSTLALGNIPGQDDRSLFRASESLKSVLRNGRPCLGGGNIRVFCYTGGTMKPEPLPCRHPLRGQLEPTFHAAMRFKDESSYAQHLAISGLRRNMTSGRRGELLIPRFGKHIPACDSD